MADIPIDLHAESIEARAGNAQARELVTLRITGAAEGLSEGLARIVVGDILRGGRFGSWSEDEAFVELSRQEFVQVLQRFCYFAGGLAGIAATAISGWVAALDVTPEECMQELSRILDQSEAGL